MNLRRFGSANLVTAFAAICFSANCAHAQASYAPPNDLPHPYHLVANWAQLPDGRKWGSTAGVEVGPDGNIWAIDRCGANTCADSSLDPILEFETSGKLLRKFGAGLFNIPHGLFVDREGNVWVTDSAAKDDKGQQVFKFSPDGKVLMTLGKAGVGGKGTDLFNGPTDVVIARNGDILVSDGHTPNYDSSRVVRFSKAGKYISEFGTKGTGDGQMMGTHSIALDSKGRVFVADRGNNRVMIFDQKGKFVAAWKQFGRPSGLFIDQHDILYVTDSESRDHLAPKSGYLEEGYGYNPGCNRGIRIGSVKDGRVTAMIPDPAPAETSSAGEGVAADHQGNVYSAEVGPKDLKKYAKD